MRAWVLSLLVAAATLAGCHARLPFLGSPEPATLEEAQAAYTSHIREGLYDDALAYVEPDLRVRFVDAIGRLREVHFSGFRTSSILIDPAGESAAAHVLYTGTWTAAASEREVEAIQLWRREDAGRWYVIPDLPALLGPIPRPLANVKPR